MTTKSHINRPIDLTSLPTNDGRFLVILSLFTLFEVHFENLQAYIFHLQTYADAEYGDCMGNAGCVMV